MRIQSFAAALLAALSVIAVPTRAADSTPAQPNQAPAPPTQKQQDIRQLLDLTHGLTLSKQLIDQLFGLQQRAMPNVPASVWQSLRQQFDPADMEPIVVAIYDRHFTSDEIHDLIAFYRSPTGQKIIAEQPQILQESLAAGQAWAADVLQRIKSELKQKGYSA